METRRDGFLSTLDWTFNRMLVPRLIRWLYVISLALVTLFWVRYLFTGMMPLVNLIFPYQTNVLYRILIALPGWALHLVLVRVYCELLMVIFKINDRLGEISAAVGGAAVAKAPGSPQAPAA